MKALARFVSIAAEAIGLEGEVSILITGNRRMRMLNRRFRHKDKPTDVLSFPAASELSPQVAGDLAISIDQARRQAVLLGHSTEAEIKVLALHGLLHLAGWDHERDSGEMAVEERRLRGQFKLPAALIERGAKAPSAGPAKARSRSSKLPRSPKRGPRR